MSSLSMSGMSNAHARTRLVVMVVAGAMVAAVLVVTGNGAYGPVAGWDAAALVFSGWVWAVIGRMNAERTRSHSTQEEPNRASTDLIVLGASVASLVAVGVVLVGAASAQGAKEGWLAGLGVGSVALSWLAVHTLFTLRYARLYYTRPDGGIDFNQTAAPRYADFAYLGFTIGMTFQVSDTTVSKPAIRATILRHALLSYLFGSVILASSVNLVVTLGSHSG